MHAFISMTSTLTAAAQDENVLADMAEPDTQFVFSCAREHALNPDRLRAPLELTWARTPDATTDAAYDGGHVDLNAVSAGQHALWTRFRAIIESADADQRVWWAAGRGEPYEDGAIYPLAGRELNPFTIADMLRADGYTVHGR